MNPLLRKEWKTIKIQEDVLMSLKDLNLGSINETIKQLIKHYNGEKVPSKKLEINVNELAEEVAEVKSFLERLVRANRLSTM